MTKFILCFTLFLGHQLIGCSKGGTKYGSEVPPVVVPDTALELQPIGNFRDVGLSVYDPDIDDSSEGGPQDFYDEPVNSVEDAIKNGRPITGAADTTGEFGESCNQRDGRCLFLVKTRGFDLLFPDYRRKFHKLPADTFLVIIEDTGSAFVGMGWTRVDLASRNLALSKSIPKSFQNAHWVRVNNPCGQTAKGRYCDFTNRRLSPLANQVMASLAAPKAKK